MVENRSETEPTNHHYRAATLHTCLYSDNMILVSFMSRRAVYYSHLFSAMGRNVQYYNCDFVSVSEGVSVT